MGTTKIIDHEGILVFHMTNDVEGRAFLRRIAGYNDWCCNRYEEGSDSDREYYGGAYWFLQKGPMCYICRKNEFDENNITNGVALWWPSGNNGGQFFSPGMSSFLQPETHRELVEKGIYRLMKKAGVFDETDRAKTNTLLFPDNPNCIPGKSGFTYETIQIGGGLRGSLFAAPTLAAMDEEKIYQKPILAFLWYWEIEKRDNLIPIIALDPITAYHHSIKLQNRFVIGEPAIATSEKAVEKYLHALSSRQLAKPIVKNAVKDLRKRFVKTIERNPGKKEETLAKMFIKRNIREVLKKIKDKTTETKAPSKRSVKKFKKEIGVLS